MWRRPWEDAPKIDPAEGTEPLHCCGFQSSLGRKEGAAPLYPFKDWGVGGAGPGAARRWRTGGAWLTQAMLLNSAVGRAPPPARAADNGVGSPRSPPPLLHSVLRGAGRGGAERSARGGAGRWGRGGVRAAALGSGRTKYSRAWIFLAGPRVRARRVRGHPDPARRAEGAGAESPSWTRLDPV